MYKSVYYMISALFLLAGLIYTVNSVPGITGFIVLESISPQKTFLIGLWYITSGIATAIASLYDGKKGFMR